MTDEIFANYEFEEGVGEILFLKAIQHIKNIEKVKRLMKTESNVMDDKNK